MNLIEFKFWKMENFGKITFTILFSLAAAVQGVWAGPKILIPDATFNFGKVPQHVKISKTYWVKSVGDDTLRILTLIPGCGCTQIPLEDSVLAPGDSCSFEVQFSTLAYRGFITKKPYLTTNAGPENVYVEFNAEVIVDSSLFQPVRLNPYKLDVSQFTVEPRRKASSWIFNLSDQDLALTMVDAGSKNFVTELPKMVKSHDSAQVSVMVNENALTKDFEQSITFRVSDETNSLFTLPVQRMYRSPQPSGGNPK